MRPTRIRTGRRWRYGTAAVAVLTLGVVSACSSSPSSSPAAASSGRRRRVGIGGGRQRRDPQLPEERDALHERHRLRAAGELEPARHRCVRHGYPGAHLRAAVPVRPGQGRVRPVAGHRRRGVRLAGHQVRHQRAVRRQVERRAAADRRRRRLLHQPGAHQRGRPVLGQRGHGRERDRERQHGHRDLQGHARLHRVHRLPVEGPGPPAAHLVQDPGEQDRDRREHAPGRHGPDDPGHRQHPGSRLPDQAGLVGHAARSACPSSSSTWWTSSTAPTARSSAS